MRGLEFLKRLEDRFKLLSSILPFLSEETNEDVFEVLDLLDVD